MAKKATTPKPPKAEKAQKSPAPVAVKPPVHSDLERLNGREPVRPVDVPSTPPAAPIAKSAVELNNERVAARAKK